ncbi:signal recognition particle-docking protein FtsY [Methanothermococcus okinawensis]|uniref:Signal recognition particle receptor FtsY n=1 Tax=Methanothermococcus okinawensis (strain DSM 14208 / JCM 11175 / IH1) TaxID=647113 RepID=F8AJU3_METOI|nr:signal recognition particle-docking protein FtsY [Methanothermococcus okinawensis]AEH07294.1 signal recognition particle-docking protein FtsY [Methanothermococcus okinawensis IH1]
MFGSLKKKLSKTVSKIADKIYSKGNEEEKTEGNKINKINNEKKEILNKKENELSEVAQSKTEAYTKDTGVVAKYNAQIESPSKLEEEIEKKEKIGFFDKFKLTKTIKKVLGKDVILTEDDIADILEELELELLEADVAYDVVERLVESLKNQLVGTKITAKDNPEEITINALKNAIKEILSQKNMDIYELIEEKKKSKEPVVIVFVGINGTGKTTSIAKLAHKLKNKGYSVVLAAGDTFRAGAIEQLEEHAKNIGVRVIKHQKGADSAAVIYDAIQHAKARGIDVVLADTAGRQATNINLMDEIKKVVRVTKPDLVVFVGDSLAGNDAINQAEEFNNAVNIDGVILTKVDADAKGGAALSIAYAIGKPILFLGVGQRYEDLEEFNVDWMVNKLFGDEEVKYSTEREF